MEENTIDKLKSKGFSCSKLKSLESQQRIQAKKDFGDATNFRVIGMEKQAQLQEKIARAQEQSADNLVAVRKRFCPFK